MATAVVVVSSSLAINCTVIPSARRLALVTATKRVERITSTLYTLWILKILRIMYHRWAFWVVKRQSFYIDRRMSGNPE